MGLMHHCRHLEMGESGVEVRASLHIIHGSLQSPRRESLEWEEGLRDPPLAALQLTDRMLCTLCFAHLESEELG